jgi:hypothetical protein
MLSALYVLILLTLFMVNENKQEQQKHRKNQLK